MFSLRMSTKFLTYVGLYFDSQQWKSDLNYNKYLRKISVINMFVFISLYFTTLINLAEDIKNPKILIKIITLSLDSCICFFIYMKRYINIPKIRRFTFMFNTIMVVMPGNFNNHENNNFRTILNNTLQIIPKILDLIMLIILNMLYIIFCEDGDFLYCYLKAHIMIIFIFELKVINNFYMLYQRLLIYFKNDVKAKYEDFYKIPVAECKKLDSGDFLVSAAFPVNYLS